MAALLSLLSGILFALALPPANVEWLGWIALAPLLYAARDRRPLEAVGLGLLTGGAAGAVCARWHSDTAVLLLGWLPFLWLAAFFGAAAWAGEYARARGWTGVKWTVFVACVGVAAEWLTTFSPLPLNIAVCQGRTVAVIQIASVTGSWGVSFLLWLTNATVADILLQKRLRLVPVVLTGTLVALSLGVGHGQQAETRSRTASLAPVSVAAVQNYTAAKPSGLTTPAYSRAVDASRIALTQQAVGQGAQLVVWPEKCLGTAFAPAEANDPTRSLARMLRTNVVAGFVAPHTPLPFNSAALVNPQGMVIGIYHKHHMFLGRRLAVHVGIDTTAYNTGLGKVGLEVCFDTCFTDVTRGLVQSGAQMIAVPNFDPVAANGAFHLLHAAQLPFRAVENRVPFVRADSNGASQIIASDGRIVRQAPLWTSAAVVGSVQPGDGGGTFFTRWGDWFAYGCAAGTFLFLMKLRRVSRKTTPAR